MAAKNKNVPQAAKRAVPAAKPDLAAKARTQLGFAPKRAAPPPKPMVTAADRMQARQVRRAAPPPAFAAPRAPAANVDPQALQAEIDRFNQLQGRALLTSVNDDLEDIEAAISALPGNLQNIRQRGYVFKSHLETQVEGLAAQWRDLRPRVEAAVPPQQRALQADVSQVQATLNRGALAGGALSMLENKVDAAVRNLEGMYDSLDDKVNEIQRQVDDISWTLQQAEQASYEFLATEAPLEAVPANWKAPDDKDGVEGVLLLTDLRLIFEQKEDVATKKVLFFTTEKQRVQELKWAIPVGAVEAAAGAKKGFMGKDDYLQLTFTSEAPFRGTELHLRGETGEAWQAHIGRVKTGEIAKERSAPVDAAVLEAVQNAPTQCANCGGAINQTIMRGQTEITCEFCGTKIRL